MKPIVIINFKTYRQGKALVTVAQRLASVSSTIPGRFIFAVQATDIKELRKKIPKKIALFSEHVDYQPPGRNTGFILPEAVKIDGARGTLLNHSEHPLSFSVLQMTINHCKKIDLQTAVFVKNIAEAKRIISLKPDYLIYEPPKLVAGTISVSRAQPRIIREFAQTIPHPFLVGAGIHSCEDVEAALKLGASGIAVSSAIITARNPGKRLKDLFI